jgi:formate hydrogenlyase transcriptional activator
MPAATPLLVNYFVSKLASRMGKEITCVPSHVMDFLTNNDWKGNIRELANFVERAVILTRGEELQLPQVVPNSWCRVHVAPAPGSTMREAESSVIAEALRAASGRVAGQGGAAERLGLKRTTLQNKMRRLNIARADYSAKVVG